MGRSVLPDLRVRIIGEIERGQACRAAARRFGVAPSTAVRLAQRKVQTGSLAPARHGRPVCNARLYRRKKHFWRAKPIAPMSSARGGCGSITVSHG